MASAPPVIDLARVVLQVRPSDTPGTPTPTDLPGGLGNDTERTVGFIKGVLPGWVPEWSIRLGLAVVVLAMAWYGSKLLVCLFGRRVARRFRRPSVTRTVLRSMRAGIMFVALLVVAAIVGVSLGDLVLSVTVLTAAIGVVIAPIIGSVINGLFVLSDQSYEIGDLIQIVDTDERGYVEDITLRYTKIFTLDNTFIVIPNGTMRDRDVINYSAEDARTRLSLDVLVTYEGDLAQARERIERAAREVEVVIEGGPEIRIGSARYPAAPTCYIDEFAEHGVALRLRYWVEEPYKLLAVRSAVQERVWAALDDADVEFAYPHEHVVFDRTSGTLPVTLDGEARSRAPEDGSNATDRPRDTANRHSGPANRGSETGRRSNSNEQRSNRTGQRSDSADRQSNRTDRSPDEDER